MKTSLQYALSILGVLVCIHVHASCPLGTLTEIVGSPFPAGAGTDSIAYSPLINNRLFLAASDDANNGIWVFHVDPMTGALTPTSGTPFVTGVIAPFSTAYSPIFQGKVYLAVLDETSDVQVFTMNTTSGNLTAVPGSPFALGDLPGAVAYSPVINNKLFAAVAGAGPSTLYVFETDPITGAWSDVPGSPFATGANPQFVAYSPVVNNNLFVAVPNLDDNTVSVYQTDPNTGALTPVPGQPFATGPAPLGVTFSPVVSGNLFAAVTNLNDDTISVYTVNTSTGAFTEVIGSPFPASLIIPYMPRFSPVVAGTLFLGVTTGGTLLGVYQVNTATGALTPAIGSPFAVPTSTYDLSIAPLIAQNLFLASASENVGNISVFKINTIIPTITTSSHYIRRGTSVTLYATITGGTPPFTVTWNDGYTQITNSFSLSRTVKPLATTCYFIATVTDALDCVVGPSNSVVLSIYPCPA